MLRYFFPLKHASLLWQLTRREVLQRFRGSWLGLGWAVIMPLAMLAVYTFVFRTVLKAKWPGAADSDSEFALQIFSGLLVFSLFSDVVGRASMLVVEQPNLVKKVVFPLELLSWVAVLSALFFAAISIVVLSGATLLMRGSLTVHIVSVPVILAVFIPLLLGFGWILSSMGVYLRDMGHLVALMLTPLLFLSPIFYPASALPALGQALMDFNPLTIIVESLRAVILEHVWPNWTHLGVYFCVSILVLLLGAFCFEKARRGFADVL